MEMEDKIDSIKKFFRDKKALVAFSGGADSTFLAVMAKKHAKSSLAVTFDNGVMPPGFLDNSQKIANKIGIEHLIVKEDLLKNPAFSSNPVNRCYICKEIIYRQLGEYAEAKEFDMVVDGTNLSDLFEDRPGVRVNQERNIKMPLIEVGFTTEEVRMVLSDMEIDYSPSTTCMATRISKDNVITMEKISQVQKAEELVRRITESHLVRVRYDQAHAQLEVPELNKVLDPEILAMISQEFKKIGFRKVMLNIDGYKTSKNNIIIFKPCTSKKGSSMMEIELPYSLDIKKTCRELKNIGQVKCSVDMGVILIETPEVNVSLFGDGKIVARRIEDQEGAQELLARIMPLIRRK